MNGIKLHRCAISALSVGIGLLLVVCLSGSVFSQLECDVFARMPETVVSENALVLPHQISCTDLEVRRLASYSGKFYEDGSEREVYEVAALELRNTSQTLIPYAYILVHTTENQYIFQATMIPPGSLVLVPESQGQGYTQSDVVRIFGWTTVLQQEEPSPVRLWQTEDGYCVENLSRTMLENFTVYHRTYISEGNIYIGGLAFQTKLPRILPGECLAVRPENYAPGYSKIVYYEEKSPPPNLAADFMRIKELLTENPANGGFPDAQKLPEEEPPPESFLRP